MKRNIYSVGQVNQYIRNLFSQDFLLKKIRVRGEVSNCKYHSSGHIYFTLKDETGAIGAVMFAGDRGGLSFRMKEGDGVVVTGRIEVYVRDGKYQLYAKQIEPDGTGNLYLRFEALKRELEEMGMFAEEYKQRIPRFAHTVGIVTAPTGAAVQDIRNISQRRNPYVQLILYPAQVQGEGAAESVVSGIHALEYLGVDVIIVGRGGGSIEDLWAFNEEIVARAIFECTVPIISAVGHETDFTIADFAADLRAPTPSAAAELAVFDYRQTGQSLMQIRQTLDTLAGQHLRLAERQLELYRTRLHHASPGNRLHENRQRLVSLEETIRGRMERLITERRHRLQLLAGGLEACSPVKRLRSGYAYVETGTGESLRSISQVRPSDSVRIELLDGQVRATVEEISERKKYQEGESDR